MAESGGPGAGKEGGRKGVSKTAMVLGAAGLFLFIVGVKRKHRLDAEREIAAERQRTARAEQDGAEG